MSSVKVQIVFPEDLLLRIDRMVGGRKRSEFVVEAAQEKLARVLFQKTLKETAGAWSAENHPETRSQKTLNKWLRKTRKETGSRMAEKNDE